MLADFFDRLTAHARAVAKVEIVEHPMLPGHVIVAQGDSHTIHRAYPKPCSGMLMTKDGVVEFCKALNSEAELFLTFDALEVVIDKADRRSRMRLPFVRSDRFRELAAVSGKKFQPREAVKFLRFKLELPKGTPILEALRKVNFDRTSKGYSVTEHGKESLGKSVEAHVQQVDSIPETFLATVPFFMNDGFEGDVKIEVGVYLDLEAGAIEFVPSSDDIERAVFAAVGDAIGKLRAELPNIPIYHGKAD